MTTRQPRAAGPSRTVFVGVIAYAVLISLAVVVLLVAPSRTGTAPGASESSSNRQQNATPDGPRAEPAVTDHLIIDGASLRALPTRGAPWSFLVGVAEQDAGSIDLADQDNLHAGRLLASALVYARTGDDEQRVKVEGALRQLPTTSLDGARVLSVARQLAGYVIAADLVGYRDLGFVEYVDTLRTVDIGGHDRWSTIDKTTKDTASNWGAWALASRIAVSAYLQDDDDLAEAAEIFRGFTGERDAYAGFQRTDAFDASWSCEPAEWVPINPASCGERGGAIVEDISRSRGDYPSVDNDGRTYSWETLGGATLSAMLLAQAGYPEVWGWGDEALLRAAEFLEHVDAYPPTYSTNQYIPWVINEVYGVDLGPVRSAGYGRQFGFSDWLRIRGEVTTAD